MVFPKSVSEVLVEPVHFSTKSLPVRDQFDAWRTFMSPAIDLDIRGTRGEAFGAEQTVWDAGSFALTRASMPADGRERVWQHHRKNALDHWCFVVVEGAAGSVGDSRRLFFRSLGDPFDGFASDTSVLSVYIPRELFGDRLTRIGNATSELPNTGIGALLLDYFTSLERRLPGMSEAELPQVIEATRAMVAACVCPNAERIEIAGGAIAATLMERARQGVRDNLGTMAFGPDHLASTLGVSRSRLYRMFEPFGGVARYIHRQRMLAAHAALSDPVDDRSVIRIAESVGFGDASGFSRGFKQEFGYSPRDARAAGAVRLPIPPSPPRFGTSSTADFAAILRRLAA